MDLLREFLESSTIHGFAYIAIAKTRIGKGLWGLVVLLCFLLSSVLIYESYVDFQNSPVVTSITIQPIKDLDFPTVTVCPPKNSSTALNYDLMRARNITLSKEERESLRAELYEIFNPVSLHEEYIRLMESAANLGNLKAIYDGYQSVPRPTEHSGLKVLMWNIEGSLETPWYGEDVDSTELNGQVQEFQMVLEFPANLVDNIGHGKLVIKIEKESGEEVVEYWEGHKYELYTRTRTWQDADTFCRGRGGHLASIKSEKEQREISITSLGDPVWVGGSDKKEEGTWSWSDGSNFSFTNWEAGFGNNGENSNCLRSEGLKWMDASCDSHRAFICQNKAQAMDGVTNLTFEYSKAELKFTTFQVWITHQADSKGNRSKRTGVRLSWKLANPLMKLEVSTNELGRTLHMPGWGKDFKRKDYESDFDYTATLKFPEDLPEQVGNNTLVIELKVDTRQEEGWVEDVKYWKGEKYRYKNKDVTWMEADNKCQEEEARLASILSEEEQHEVNAVEGIHHWATWIGASDRENEGEWTWVDGSPWSFTNWGPYYKNTENRNCIVMYMMDEGEWDSLRSCSYKLPYLCKAAQNTLVGNTSLRLEFTRDNLTFSSFQLVYRYETSSSQLLDSWKDARMTGFELNWFIESRNGSRQTETLPQVGGEWRNKVSIPEYQELWLTNTSHLARHYRQQNLSREEMVQRIVRKKMMATDFVHKSDLICMGGQVKTNHYKTLFEEVLNEAHDEGPITKEEDRQNGFVIFVAIVYCPHILEELKLYKFVDDLLTSQSPGTIMRATINTIEAATLNEDLSAKFNTFFKSLDKVFELHYGMILLASSSPSSVREMLALDRPYFPKDDKYVEQCRDGFCESLLTEMEDPEGLKHAFHPSHVISGNGTLLPGALIPFCSYQSDWTKLGKKANGLDFDACDQFKPSVLNGELCFSLKLDRDRHGESANGKWYGLLLVIDPNTAVDEGQAQVPEHTKDNEEENDKFFARVSLDTLSHFSEIRNGSYAITALKQVTASESFMKLPEEERGCQKETKEECEARNFLIEIQQTCNCIPWDLTHEETDLDLKERPFCTTEDHHSCISEISNKSFGCMHSCTGLYADVAHKDEDNCNKELKSMLQKYRKHKDNFAKNIKFDPSKKNFTANVETKFQVMRFYFNTALFDEVRRDKSSMLPIHQWIGLVGGTMGLFTGFSILSIVEILYFGAKFLTRSRKPKHKC